MRRLFSVTAFCTGLSLAAPVWAQTSQPPPQKPPPPPAPPAASQVVSEDGTRPLTTTKDGDTGLWFVPSAEVLRHKRWAASLYRVNYDDGQGFTDMSLWPVTFAIGLGERAEFFGNWVLVTRIDRDTRPLFFHSTAGEEDTGTGGGMVVPFPKVRTQWTGNDLGDIWLGGKINLLSQADLSPAAVGVRGMVKLPVGDDGDGASTGKADFIIDGIVSRQNSVVELAGYGGFIVRGSPDNYELTNGFRWGFGAALPQKAVRLTAELFGESYFDNSITGPAEIGEDGSFVPTQSFVKSPVFIALGVTFQASNGFFIGAGGSWNLTMAGRSEATPGCPVAVACTPVFNTFNDESGDKAGIQFRVGFHPGVRRYVAPTPPPPAPPPVVAPPTPTNRPPTVKAACDPCTVEVGRTSTVSAEAQDPDGDPLTCFWTAKAGNLTNATARSTPWTAPNQVGVVPITITCNDGKGGTASDTVNINVIAPARKTYTFEDVHFDFDRYTLRPDALKILDEAVTAMQADTTLRLVIEGHTCNIGTAEYNLALGERRAQAVREYLTSRGISGDRVRTVSYGEERPRYDNSREETRRLNRRAALTVDLRSSQDPDY
jgi:outer membrane protein OmpA-like peptidoglycan-associated protein